MRVHCLIALVASFSAASGKLLGSTGSGLGFTEEERVVLNAYYAQHPDAAPTDHINSSGKVGEQPDPSQQPVSFDPSDTPRTPTSIEEYIAHNKHLAGKLVSQGAPSTLTPTPSPTQSPTPLGDDGLNNLKVIGADDRIRLGASDMDLFPYRTIGRFIFDGSYCTATMVGEYIAITNRHCLSLSNGALRPGFYEYATVRFGESQSVWNYQAYINRVVASPAWQDWAILQLTEPIGQYTGYMSVEDYALASFEATNYDISIAGYSGDLFSSFLTPSVHHNCGTTGTDIWGDVLHNCDITGGSSGSVVTLPNWYNCARNTCTPNGDVPTVIGVNFAESVNFDINYAKPSEYFYSAVEEARGWTDPNPRPTPAPTSFSDNFCTDGVEELAVNPGFVSYFDDGYRLQYPNMLNKCWLLVAEPGRNVKLEFENLDLEAGYDFVNVYDLPDTFSMSEAADRFEGIDFVANFTGGVSIANSRQIVSRSRFMLVQLRTDYSVTEEGFEAKFQDATPVSKCFVSLGEQSRCSKFPRSQKVVSCSGGRHGRCSKEDCEDTCANTENCGGYEFQQRRGKCTLYMDSVPTFRRRHRRTECVAYGPCP